MDSKNSPPKRVLLAVATHELKTAFFLAFGSEPHHQIVGTAVNTAELLTFTRALNPDIILLEWELPGTPMVEMITSLIQRDPKPQIFFISAPSSQQECLAAAKRDDAIHVESSPENLISSLLTL